jgi:hypothetical protein
MQEENSVENRCHIYERTIPALRRLFLSFVFALAMMCNSTVAQTTNHPAQPSDWERPNGPYAVVMEEDEIRLEPCIGVFELTA